MSRGGNTKTKENSMMTLQAREMHPSRPSRHHPLRAYPTGSPRAKARLVALALLADGRLADGEIDTLDRNGAFVRLGISRSDFFEVMADFCADLVRLPEGKGNAVLTPAMLAGLFAEVENGEDRTRLLQLIFEVAHSDGTISGNEEKLLRHAIEHWAAPDGSERQRYRDRPEHHYG
jgi:uncharacterized tellurite resistance protein B-like protein